MCSAHFSMEMWQENDIIEMINKMQLFMFKN